jgi:hypothetical protein
MMEVGLRKTQNLDEKTAAQNEWQAKHDAEHVELRRVQCNAYLLWHICRYKICRRAHTCSRDPVACFDRHWPIIPEEMKMWWRTAIPALHAGATPAEAVAAAQAGLARWKTCKIENEREEAKRTITASGVAPQEAQPSEQTHAPARVRIV